MNNGSTCNRQLLVGQPLHVPVLPPVRWLVLGKLQPDTTNISQYGGNYDASIAPIGPALLHRLSKLPEITPGAGSAADVRPGLGAVSADRVLVRSQSSQ